MDDVVTRLHLRSHQTAALYNLSNARWRDVSLPCSLSQRLRQLYVIINVFDCTRTKKCSEPVSFLENPDKGSFANVLLGSAENRWNTSWTQTIISSIKLLTSLVIAKSLVVFLVGNTLMPWRRLARKLRQQSSQQGRLHEVV